MTEQQNRFLETALRFISLGCKAVILGKQSKETVTVHTPNGLLDATLDPEVAKAWWDFTPKCNVGVVCGETAEKGRYLTIIDWDVDQDDGTDAITDVLNPWEAEHGELPETVTEITGRGGMHHFYWTDRPVPKFESKELHVDIRGVGSYAMVAPSIHPNGNEVAWENHPDDFEIAWADENVYALIETVLASNPEKENGTRREKVKAPKKTKKGEGRNNFLYEQGCSLRGSRDDADDDYIAAWLTTLNQMFCVPPVDERELNKVIGSVCKLPIGMSEEVKQKISSRGDGGGGDSSGPRSHVAIANAVMDRYNACFLDGSPAVFDGLTYKIGWDSVERAILNVRRDATDKARNEVVKYLRLVMPHEKSSPPNFIGFTNGILDIDTMELMSFTPDMRIPNIIPHDWNPDARSDVLDHTMQKIACGDPFIEHNLFEFIGLCMYRSGKYAYAAVLLGNKGKTASNGKSTYIDLMRNVIGEDNYSVLDLNELGQRFQAGDMAGKLANLADDISSEFARGGNLTVFKKVVAGIEIKTDVKNKAGFKFVPYCTMVLSANKFPKLETPDDGVMRRLHPIRFNAHFTPNDPDFDPDIGAKLKSEECIEAAIVRGIEGLRRVIRQKRPTPNAESESMANAIKVENSSILQWVEDAEIERSDFIDGWTTKGAYDAYSAWCHESGIRNPYGKPQFGMEVCNHFKLETYSTRDENRRGIRRYREIK